ncbi:hypothetical protein H2200_012422 [Cladophialophora chaetospira]|uniref:C6 transcription factor n=1 Tax=Cladophialophora chaetospira TaxID=386627 RepID=A0AA39CCD6_9EURO|nr:hypothetical protein H2200_012422 [Cladophialophora chaetospira]
MPTTFAEDINFSTPDEKTPVCLSPYQIQLNQVYQIASPLLENIYGVRFSRDPHLRSEMPTMVSKIDSLMRDWQENLPTELNLEKKGDISLTTPIEAKLHRLQALSLQLTYDNLMIVIHRPLLADQTQRRPHSGQQNYERSESSTSTGSSHHDSFQQCLTSALRISQIQQSNRNLLALARRTHLVSFIGMNLFTSSVVLFIRALSNTLSDIAQESKRGITRNLKMLKLLSGDGSLSMQCSKILEDLVQMIFDKEKEEMLRSLPSEDEVALLVPTRRSSVIDGHQTLSVEGSSGEAWSAAHPSEAGLLSAGEAAPIEGGFLLQQTIDSLQKVFKDAQTPKAPAIVMNPDIAGHATDLTNNGASQGFPLGENRPEQSGLLFDGANFHAEDLGQLWLWNLDPYRDDFSSWQLDDDFQQQIEGH